MRGGGGMTAINVLMNEIKRLKRLFFEKRDCRTGRKGEWCANCDMLDAVNKVCIVDDKPMTADTGKSSTYPQPRYDDVYQRGVEWLDSLDDEGDAT